MQEVKKDFSTLYEPDALHYWQTRYPDNVRWNFDNLLLGNLTPDERRGAGVVRLDSPLLPQEGMRDFPLVFYATSPPPTITAPILSIKFLDDLSIASAWLELNGYSQETLVDYISMLKYANPARFEAGQFPPPLEALHVPHNALENEQVDSLAQKVLKSALLWIVAHELGHIVYAHPGYREVPRQKAQQNEIEADRFATEIFRRIGTVPGGITLLLTLLVNLLPHRGDFASDAAWEEYARGMSTHPLSTERLKALAAGLRAAPHSFAATEPNQEAAVRNVETIAQETEKIARLLQSAEQQKFLRARALAVTLESLAPRPIGEVHVWLGVKSGTGREPQAFDGIYYGEHTRRLAKGGTETLAACFLLERQGIEVNGRFSFGVGEGKLTGRISNNQLYFDWEWGEAYGRGLLTCSKPCSLGGHWGYEDSREDGGTWTGQRDDPRRQPAVSSSGKTDRETAEESDTDDEKEGTMLFQLLSQVNSRIESLDIEAEAPLMLRQIGEARPDFLQYLNENAPNQKVAELTASAVAHGILLLIKEIPTIVNVMVSHLRSPSTDPAARCAVAGILVYLVQPRDLIPDDAPGGYGFVDDNAILRAGLIEYMNLLPESAENVETERNRIQLTARVIPLHLVEPLQLAIDGMATTLQLLRMLPGPMLEFTLQQMLSRPLQLPAIQQPSGFTPSPGPSLGTGHWSGGAYFEGNDVIIPGGPSLIDGQLFIPD